VGSSITDDGATTAVVVPRASSEADVYEPADLAEAGVEISTAFRDVFGPAGKQTKIDAIQLGPELQPLLRRSADIAKRFGYTPDQLARNVVTVALRRSSMPPMPSSTSRSPSPTTARW